MTLPDTSRIEVPQSYTYGVWPGYYFGYGLEADPSLMDFIVGRQLVHELGVVAVGKTLEVQRIDQVPNIPVEALGGISVQQLLDTSWKEHTGLPFLSYTMCDSQSLDDRVSGTLYELEQGDATTLMEWDLATPGLDKDAWRVWTPAKLIDGRGVMTLVTNPNQETDRKVDGMGYDKYLNRVGATLKVIYGFRTQQEADHKEV